MVTGSKIAAVYADALLGAALESDLARELEGQLADAVALISKDAMLWAYFKSPVVDPGRKIDVLKKAFGSRVDQLLVNFLCVLARRRRMDVLPELDRVYSELLDQKINRRRVEVSSVRPLESSEQKRLLEELEKVLKAEVVLQQKEDPDLVGGLKIKAGDLMFDGSVSRKLSLLKEKMQAHKIYGEEYYEN